MMAAEWAPVLEAAGVPCFEVPSRAVSAAAMLADFAARADRATRAREPARIAARVDHLRRPGVAALGEHEAKQWLEAYGIPTPRRVFVALDAPRPAFELSFPVVAKIVSPDLPHKTEAGGVRVGVQRHDLERTLIELRDNAMRYKPGARIEGFLIEEQAEGLEMIVGALNNPSFGPLVLVGMGGVQAEIFRDVARRYAPIDIDTAREMVMSLKAVRLLQGYRGEPPRDIDALCEVISRVSWMIADHEATVSEIEINPVMVGEPGRGVRAVDAIVRFNKP